jgi:Ser/Thr protein kinase RdoA (MazF antagonist)
MEADLQNIACAFAIEGTLLSVSAFKSGHINETYRSTWNTQKGQRFYIHQRINNSVFKNVAGLMQNISKITAHVQRRLAAAPNGDKTLTVVPTKTNALYLEHPRFGFWRTYEFIPDSLSFDVCPDAPHAYEAARTFGRFLSLLGDFPAAQLVEPIARFQDTSLRYEQLDDALARDVKKRKAEVRAEIDFALSRRSTGLSLVESLRSGKVPLRATHSDPKVNNVLFSTKTNKGFCIVDLDTCMPGTILYDFGDLVRSTAVSSAEDEIDLSKVRMSMEYFEALASGFGESFGAQLTPGEIELLPIAPPIIALTLGIRFLTDYINGDTYFRIHREKQNLDRSRAQFQIVRSMEAQRGEMEAAVRRAVVSGRKS